MSKRTIKLMNLGKEVNGTCAVRVVRDSDYEEFQVQLLDEHGKFDPDASYYTSEKSDALDTAQWMFNHLLNGAI